MTRLLLSRGSLYHLHRPAAASSTFTCLPNHKEDSEAGEVCGGSSLNLPLAPLVPPLPSVCVGVAPAAFIELSGIVVAVTSGFQRINRVLANVRRFLLCPVCRGRG